MMDMVMLAIQTAFQIWLVGLMFSTTSILSLDPHCLGLPGVTGSCRAMITMYTYHPDLKTCQDFTYGGCETKVDGILISVNKFMTLEKCEEACEVSHTTRCYGVPKLHGPCNGNETMYSYHMETSECKEFTYGGCPVLVENNYDISINRFETKKQCEKGNVSNINLRSVVSCAFQSCVLPACSGVKPSGIDSGPMLVANFNPDTEEEPPEEEYALDDDSSDALVSHVKAAFVESRTPVLAHSGFVPVHFSRTKREVKIQAEK